MSTSVLLQVCMSPKLTLFGLTDLYVHQCNIIHVWFHLCQTTSFHRSTACVRVCELKLLFNNLSISLVKQIHGNYRPLPLPRQNFYQVQLDEMSTDCTLWFCLCTGAGQNNRNMSNIMLHSHFPISKKHCSAGLIIVPIQIYFPHEGSICTSNTVILSSPFMAHCRLWKNKLQLEWTT